MSYLSVILQSISILFEWKSLYKVNLYSVGR